MKFIVVFAALSVPMFALAGCVDIKGLSTVVHMCKSHAEMESCKADESCEWNVELNNCKAK